MCPDTIGRQLQVLNNKFFVAAVSVIPGGVEVDFALRSAVIGKE